MWGVEDSNRSVPVANAKARGALKQESRYRDVPGNAQAGVEGANRTFASGTPNPPLPNWCANSLLGKELATFLISPFSSGETEIMAPIKMNEKAQADRGSNRD